MPNNKKIKSVKAVNSIEALKQKIDEERQEWDRPENHGSSQVASSFCMKRIEALQKELKENHGIDY